MSATKKAADEVKCSRSSPELPVSRWTRGLQQAGSPEPDILCSISGSPYYFELGRLVDEDIPRKVTEAMQRLEKGDRRPTGGFASFTAPMMKMVRDKTSNRYDVGTAVVDLVLYYDSKLPTMDCPPPAGPAGWRERAEEYLLPEIQRNPGHFSRFWVFDRNDGKVLWRYP